MEQVDVAIIGAGVVGLAVAERLSGEGRTVVILEKNERHGKETSSRNSEVIHAGIYYPPQSLKARLCLRGKEMLYKYCADNNIPHKKLGKVIVAMTEPEEKPLLQLYETASRQTEVKLITGQEVCRMEPVIKARAGIYSPTTGILSADLFMDSLLKKAEAKDAMLITQSEVTGIEKNSVGYEISARNQENFIAKIVINCAGLFADKVAAMPGLDIDEKGYRQKFVKGEYFRINRGFNISRLVYPLPDELGLGTHITLDMEGRIRVGPNAFPVDSVNYSVDVAHKQDFFLAAKIFIPELTQDDLYPDTSGVRPKLEKVSSDKPDFIISHESQYGLPGFVNLIGIESPGLTAGLAIAEHVETLIKDML